MNDASAEPADGLRNVDQLSLPDVRMRHFSVQESDTVRALTQDDRHAAISTLSLGATVPEEIRTLFDTARNVYLYAWFVYRFHVVAEQYALTSQLRAPLSLEDSIAIK